MSPKLLVINPEHCMEVQFEQQITMGRDVFNSLSLQDPEVSRSHAIIFEQESEMIIKDLKSRNGIYVRGDKFVESTLQPGDEIIVGATVMIYEPPDTLDLNGVLSKRGKYLVGKRVGVSGDDAARPVTIYTMKELDQAVETLLKQTQKNSFFNIDIALFLLRAIKDMNDSPDATQLLERGLRHATEYLGGHRGVIMETDEEKKHLKVRAILSTDNSETVRIGQPILRVLLEAEKAIYCPDVAQDRRFECDSAEASRVLHSFVACPIRSGDELFGFIYLDSEDKGLSYDFSALRSLYMIASHMGALLRSRDLHFKKYTPSESAEVASVS